MGDLRKLFSAPVTQEPKLSGTLRSLFAPSTVAEANAENVREAAEEAGPVYGREHIAKVKREARVLPPSQFRDIELKKAKSAELQAKTVRGDVKDTLRAGGDTAPVGSLRALITNQPAPPPVKSTLVKVLDTVDEYTAEPARHLAEKALGLPKDVSEDSPTFHAALRSAAGQGNIGAKAVETAKAAAGGAAVGLPLAGAAGMAAGAVLGPIVENIPGKEEMLSKVAGPTAAKVAKGTYEFGKDLGWDVATDWLTYLTGGGSVEAKALPRLAALATKSGAAAADVDEAVNIAGKIMQRADNPKVIKSVTKVLGRVGLTPEQVAKELGEYGQYIGRAGLKWGVGPLKATIIPEGGAAKAVDAIASRLTARPLKQLAGQSVGDLPMAASTLKRHLRGEERITRATQLVKNEEMLASFEPIAQQAKLLGKGKVTQLLREAVDPSLMKPRMRGPLATDESKFVDDLGNWFKKYEPDVTRIGVKLAKNPKSGLYYPRNFGDATQIASDALPSSLLAKHGIAAPNLQARTSIKALGDATEYTPDLAKDVAQYARQISTARGFHDLEKHLTRRFTDPATKELLPEAKRFLVSSFPSVARTLERVGKLRGGEPTLGMKAEDAALKAVDFVNTHWKKSILAHTPAFHTINVWGDSGLMFNAGVNVPQELPRAKLLLASSSPAAKARVSLAKRLGVVKGGTGARFELPGSSQVVRNTNRLRLADGTASARTKLMGGAHKVWSKVPGHQYAPVSGAFADEWTDVSRLAAFNHAIDVEKMSPARAADFVNKVLIDYGAPGSDGWIRRVIPFFNYISKAPVSVATGVARRPGRFMIPDKVSRAANNEQSSEAPFYAQEKGRTIGASDVVKEGMSRLNELMGGERVVGGLHIQPRMGAYEALGLPLQALKSAGAALGGDWRTALGAQAQNLGPLPKFAIEALTNRDLLSNMDKPEHSLAREVLAPTFVPRPVGEAANIALPTLFPGAPDRVYGYDEDVDPLPGNARAANLMGTLFGIVPRQTGPSTGFYNQTLQPEARNLKDTAAKGAREAKKLKERSRRERKHTK